MVEMAKSLTFSGGAEGVVVLFPLHTPVFKADREFDGRLGLTQKLGLIQAKYGVDVLNRRDSGFTNTDYSDGFGLNQLNFNSVAQHPLDQRCGHPTGGAATDDYNFADFVLHENAPCIKKALPALDYTSRALDRNQ